MKDLCIHLAMTLTRKIFSNCADLLKSACRDPPICRFSQISHSLQIYWNLHAEISPPQFADFCKSATHCRFTEICMQRFPPQFADFLKSATHCRFTEICMQRSSHLQIFSNQPLTADLLKSAWRDPPRVCRFSQISHSLQIYWNLHEEIPPGFADFLKSGTRCRFTETACRDPPSLQIFSNQPLTADFLKSACRIRFTEIYM